MLVNSFLKFTTPLFFGDFYSCERVLWLEERRFWTLEIIILVLGLVSSTFVMWRQRLLERQSMQRLQKQINI